MKRREFLGAAMGAFPVAAASAADESKRASEGPKSDKGIKVAASADRFDKRVKFAVGHIECKISGKETGGALYVFETYTAPEDRPARHLHDNQDEWFYVLEGEYVFEVGEEKFRLKSGESIFAPRKVPHVWACISEKPGKMLVVLQPAGKLEDFFRELPKYTEKATPADFEKLYADHEMKVVGPPLPLK
jgi:quercetin dioxygenase-like cupin family protein